MAGGDEFAQQVEGVDAHAGDSGEEAAADEADSHFGSAALRKARLAGMAQSAAVALAAELDADEAVEADVVQRGEDAGNVHVAFAEGKVDVDAAFHVLDGDGGDVVGEVADGTGRVAFAGDDAVAGVEGKAKVGNVQRRPVIGCFDQHAWLGFEGGNGAQRFGATDDLLDAVAKPGFGVLRCHAGLGHAGPE